MHSMSAIAGPKWASMSDAQKHGYNQRAKMEKAGLRGGSNSALAPPLGGKVPTYDKMDCTGQKLSVS